VRFVWIGSVPQRGSGGWTERIMSLTSGVRGQTHRYRVVVLTRSAWTIYKGVLFRGGFAGEHGGADGCAIETEFRGDDFGRFKTRLKCAAFYFLDDGVED
jgi:hypothetical protein